MEQTSDPNSTITTRRISFEPSLEGLPKLFATDEDLIRSHLVAVLTSLFPDGEDFFVAAVRHYRDRITDPVLKKQVAGFIGQEAIHGREHRVLNNALADLGYPTHRIEKMTAWGLGMRLRKAPPITNLALTAALEHYTATLAELLLTSDLEKEFSHEGIRDVFLWHALEESEHKAVAFDVYKAVGGSERMRIWTMKVLRPGFAIFLAIHVLVSILSTPEGRKRGALRKSWRSFKQSEIVSKDVWSRLKEYDRRGFHPNDRDTTELEAKWRGILFGEEGTLNELLVTKAAA